ncbi:MAG: tRNA (N6-isopentenyl adenosine(37)-C2)-methylthiotransferase MiaB [Armatimonadetes bacterium]|nr:tRNA (N6-isopentenyl adenosine(37)-C2)-methylthiotransferase MiaB [Armatimonadota bacterium]
METIQPVIRLGTYYLQTYGCQMNEYDSELIGWMFEQLHYAPTDDPELADVAIFNTCCVRDNADQKVYGRLGDFKVFKRKNSSQVLAVAGCLAQKDGERFLERFPQVDVVVGTHNLQDIPDLVRRVQSGEGRFVKVDRAGDHFALPANPRAGHRAMVTISMGCAQWCTFCIVPYVRGRLKSRPHQQIVSEVSRLAREGHREILLLGQNVNDYGRDLDGNYDFARLLGDLKKIRGLDRLRFTSPHPAYFTQAVIEAMAENPAVCEHVHLPFQAGDDAVLQRMRRGYTQEDYLDLVRRMRQALPGLSITTDIIVGFPGETEEQFEATLDVVRAVRFSGAFMFAYSPRPGTPGALFPDQVAEEQKMDRLHRLIDLQNSLSKDGNDSLLGREFEVLVEGRSKKDPERFTARTRCHRLVHFPAPGHGDLTGLLARVRLEEAYTWGFVGRALEVETRPGQRLEPVASAR